MTDIREERCPRNVALEEAARANCEHCAKSKAIAFDYYLGVWTHAKNPCASFRIWELRKGNPKHGRPVNAFTQSILERRIYMAEDVTPKALGCLVGESCPAIFKVDGGHIIVGSRRVWDDLPSNIREKIGGGEIAIFVPDGLVVPDGIES